jgi:ADP-heptose:LPS heptosyltransferase
VHAETSSSKTWETKTFIDLLDQFLQRHDDFIAFNLGESQPPLDAGKFGDRIIPCAGLPISVAFNLVGSADLFLGVDSCMLHVADFHRVPGIGLFGPTSSSEFGFRLGPHRHVCGDGSMDSISVHQVLDALESILHASKGNTNNSTMRAGYRI